MKTKKLIILFVLLSGAFSGYAQGVAIGEREFTAHSSAILEMQSQNKGMLIPRVTFTQRMHIQTNASAMGLLVFQTDRDIGFWYFDGLVWQHLAPPEKFELPGLATVATSGSYNDLLHKPFIPVHLRDLDQDNIFYMTVTRQEKERWDMAAVLVGSTDGDGTITFSVHWNDITNKPVIPEHLRDLRQDDLYFMTVSRAEKEAWNAAAAAAGITVDSGGGVFSIHWNDISGKPSIPTHLRDLEQDNLFYMTVNRQEKERWDAKSDFSGRYTDLQNTPSFHQVATSGNYLHLDNRPVIPTHLRDLLQDNLYYMTVDKQEKDAWNAKSNFSGRYVDLQGLPTIPTHLRDLQQDNLYYMTVDRQEKDRWNNAAAGSTFSGSWFDLTNRPTIPTHLADLQSDNWAMTVTREEKETWSAKSNFSGRFEDLQNTPNFHQVATSGDYEHLSNKPLVPTRLTDLQECIGGIISLHVSRAEKDVWNAKSNFSGHWLDIQNRPDFAQVATSGNYLHLENRPFVPTTLRDLNECPMQTSLHVSQTEKTLWNEASRVSLETVPISRGGTGATDIISARTMLGIPPNVPQINYSNSGTSIVSGIRVNEHGQVVEISSRTLSSSDVSAAHPTYTPRGGTALGGNQVFSDVQVDNMGHVFGFSTRALTAGIGGGSMGDAGINIPSWSPTIDNERSLALNTNELVNTNYLHRVLSGGIGDHSSVSRFEIGDIVSTGTGGRGYKLEIRNSVELQGTPTIEGFTDYPTSIEGRRTSKAIPTIEFLMARIEDLENRITSTQTTAINTAVSKVMPVGAIIIWNESGTTPDGRTGSQSCWRELNMAGRFPVGAGTYEPVDNSDGPQITYTAGQTQDGGSTANGRSRTGRNQVALTMDQMPKHDHTQDSHNHNESGTYTDVRYYRTRVPGEDWGRGNGSYGSNLGMAAMPYSTPVIHQSGGDQPHENRPPFHVVRFFEFRGCPN